MEKTTPRRIGAIEVGFRLVRVLEAADGPLPLKELSERAGMPPSKAYAYVASFVHEGILAQEPATGRYGLGRFAIALGVAALRQSDLIDVARRESVALSEATTCSVMLTMWGNRGPAIVHRFDGKQRGPTSVRVGYVLPVWRSASGRVFVAHLPRTETAELLAEEEPGLDPREVDAEVAQIRAAGFAVTEDAVQFTGIAAPIVDHDGQIVAVLSFSRPYDHNTREHRVELGPLVRDAALAISRGLGHSLRPAANASDLKGSSRGLGKRNAANPV